MIIPDKNFYLEDNNFLHIDYEYIYNEISQINIKNIDIRDINTLMFLNLIINICA